MAKGKQEVDSSDGALKKRLDALIRLTIEVNKPETKGLNEGEAARMLKSVGLSPTDIALILGKKSRTEVSKYLY